MNKLSDEKKVMIGLILNKVCTALFVLFFIVTCVLVTVGLKLYLILVISIAVIFAVCSLISHKFLKDYKP